MIRQNEIETSTEFGTQNCCESPNINLGNGRRVCFNCGTVLGVEYSQSEKRAFTHEEINNRKQTEITRRAFGPRTLILNENKDGKGRPLNTKTKTKMRRLSKIQKSLISGFERNLWEAKPRMVLLCSKLNVPKHVFIMAWSIYTMAARKKLMMGRSIDGFIAASLYSALRFYKLPRVIEDVIGFVIVSRRSFIRSLGILFKEVLPKLNLNYKPITPEELISSFGNKLEIPMEMQREANELLKYSRKQGLTTNGKDPKGYAACAIYIVAKSTDYRITQKQVARIANITEVTLRTRIKDFKEVSPRPKLILYS